MKFPDLFFRDPSTLPGDAFDEGPVIVHKPTIFTSSIDTSAIDKFRQGVEITQLKHFDAGSFVKIHSGDPGHILKRTTYGESVAFVRSEVFVDRFDLAPELLLSASIIKNSRDFSTVPMTSAPAPARSSDFYENFLHDGAFDPLGASSRNDRFSPTAPAPGEGVRGALQSGNEASEIDGASDITVSIFQLNTMRTAFDDAMAIAMRWPLEHRGTTAVSVPYIDQQRTDANVVSSSVARNASMVTALLMMSSSTQNYVQVGFKSACCGWDYDGTMLGADSIAFGGLTY